MCLKSKGIKKDKKVKFCEESKQKRHSLPGSAGSNDKKSVLFEHSGPTSECEFTENRNIANSEQDTIYSSGELSDGLFESIMDQHLEQMFNMVK